MNALTQPQRFLQAAQGLDASVQVSTPDYVSQYTQQPERWQYDIDPATGVARASYPGEVNIAGNPVGGPTTGTGAQVLQTSPTINTPTLTGLTNGVSLSLSGTLGVTGAITPSQTAGIVGTTAANNANAGAVGEYITATLASGSAVNLTSNTAATVTQISLTAGDWNVWGSVYFTASVGAGTFISAVNTTAATLPAVTTAGYTSLAISVTDLLASAQTIPTMRFSLAATTTVYLIALTTFGSGTVTAYGSISARRVR